MPGNFLFFRRIQPVVDKSLATHFHLSIGLKAKTQNAFDACAGGRDQDRDRFHTHFAERAADELFVDHLSHAPVIRVKDKSEIGIAFFWLQTASSKLSSDKGICRITSGLVFRATYSEESTLLMRLNSSFMIYH